MSAGLVEKRGGTWLANLLQKIAVDPRSHTCMSPTADSPAVVIVEVREDGVTRAQRFRCTACGEEWMEILPSNATAHDTARRTHECRGVLPESA
jgi:hypothetical protein